MEGSYHSIIHSHAVKCVMLCDNIIWSKKQVLNQLLLLYKEMEPFMVLGENLIIAEWQYQKISETTEVMFSTVMCYKSNNTDQKLARISPYHFFAVIVTPRASFCLLLQLIVFFMNMVEILNTPY